MFVFPAHLFNPGTVHARVVPNAVSGGVSLSGEEDVIVTDGGGRWEITFTDISLHSSALLKAWDAWLDHMAGGSVDVLVPVLSLDTAPAPYHGRGPAMPSDLVADGKVFATSVRFAEPYITAHAGAPEALRSTSMSIVVDRGSPLDGGEKFEIGGRVYRVGRNLGGSRWTITPPLRAPVSQGAAINFDWPLLKCRMRPEDHSAPVLMGQFSDPSITFIESFTE